jgi:hypothetical protein
MNDARHASAPTRMSAARTSYHSGFGRIEWASDIEADSGQQPGKMLCLTV